MSQVKTKVNPPRIYFVACDTGVKKMLVDTVEYGPQGYFVRGKVFSANRQQWSAGSHWRRPIDFTAHGSDQSARAAYKAWKQRGGHSSNVRVAP